MDSVSEREERYAEAILEHFKPPRFGARSWTLEPSAAARTVIALADAEVAEARAEIERLSKERRALLTLVSRETGETDLAAGIGHLIGRLAGEEEARDEARAALARVESLADATPTHGGQDLEAWVNLASLRRALGPQVTR